MKFILKHLLLKEFNWNAANKKTENLLQREIRFSYELSAIAYELVEAYQPTSFCTWNVESASY